MAQIVKLISGEDVICTTEEIGDNKIKLIKPARLAIVGGSQGGQLAMMPWCPFTDEKEFVIPKSQVLFVVDAEDDIANGYNQQFGSGLVTPPQNLRIRRAED